MENTNLYKAIYSDDLEAVKTALETDVDLNKQDCQGYSYLHIAVIAKASVNIFLALLEKVDFAVRDIYGQTALDLVTADAYSEEAEQAIKSRIIQLAEQGDVDKLLALLVSGWNVWPFTAKEAKGFSEEVLDFVQKIESVQFKVARIHQAIEQGRVRDVKCLIDRKLLVTAADQTGMNALQKAVVFQEIDIVNFILGEFPVAVNLIGIMGRTSLHYAAGCEEDNNLYQLLVEAGADEDIVDVLGHTPRDYREDPEELSLSKIKETVLEIVEKNRPQELRSKTSQLSADADLSPSKISQSESERTTTPPPSRKPVSMYISTDIYWKRNIPPPNTIDGKYVAKNLGTALTMALAEIAERRPWDPIEYLAQWLYKYRENLDYNQRQEDLLEEIRREEKELEEEEKRRFRRKQEQKRIEAIEAEKIRQIEEAERIKREYAEQQEKIKADALARVQAEREKEEKSMYKDRDESGQTELHRLASQPGADLVALIDMNYSLADRDCFNKTPRDIALACNILEHVETIDSYIGNMIEQEKIEEIQQLLLDGYGYSRLKAILDTVSTDGLPEEVTEFIATLPDLQEKISTLFRAVESGVVRDVAQALTRRKLALSKDIYGRSPLHMAVLLELKDIAEYIVKRVPITVKCRDNMNRTPLHYAMAISDELTELLQSNEADPEAQDVKKRTPSFYKEEKYEILQLKEHIKTEETTDENAGFSSSQTEPSADEAARAADQADSGDANNAEEPAPDDILE